VKMRPIVSWLHFLFWVGVVVLCVILFFTWGLDPLRDAVRIERQLESPLLP
jgi:hypothetical protein